MTTNKTPAQAHAENALSELARKLEEGSTLIEAWEVGADYLEDMAPSVETYREAAEIFGDDPRVIAALETL